MNALEKLINNYRRAGNVHLTDDLLVEDARTEQELAQQKVDALARSLKTGVELMSGTLDANKWLAQSAIQLGDLLVEFRPEVRPEVEKLLKRVREVAGIPDTDQVYFVSQ